MLPTSPKIIRLSKEHADTSTTLVDESLILKEAIERKNESSKNVNAIKATNFIVSAETDLLPNSRQGGPNE